jgi:ribonuclease D
MILREAFVNNQVIGVDCEGALEMSRFGILCLIQVTNFIKARFPF